MCAAVLHKHDTGEKSLLASGSRALASVYFDRHIESCVFCSSSSQLRSWVKILGGVKCFLLKVKLEILTLGFNHGVFRMVRMGSRLSPLRLEIPETSGAF